MTLKTLRNFIKYFFTTLTGFACLLITIIVVVILFNIVKNGLPGISIEFLTEAPRKGLMEGGIFPAIYGTAMLVILMSIFVAPLGVAAAVYMHEYAPKDSKLLQIVQTAIQNLAGVPAIVFGLFGLGFFVLFVGRGLDNLFFGGELVFGRGCILWAAMTMAILTLPTVVVATEEALRAVPQSYREAAYALGATKWQVIWKVLLPQAIPGILTGCILAVSRGSGEVSPVLFVGVLPALEKLPTALNDQFMELGYHIFVLTTQSPNVEATKPILYSTILVLIILTLTLNFTAIIIRSRLRRKYQR